MRRRFTGSSSQNLLTFGLFVLALASACSRTDPDGETVPFVLVDSHFPNAGGATGAGTAGPTGAGGAVTGEGGAPSSAGGAKATGGSTSSDGGASVGAGGHAGTTSAEGGASTGGAPTIPSCDQLPPGSGNCVSGPCKAKKCPQLPPVCGGPDGKEAINFAPGVCVMGTCTQSAFAQECSGVCVVQGTSANCHATGAGGSSTGTGGASTGEGGASTGEGGASVGMGGSEAAGGGVSTGGSSSCISQPGEVCDPVCQNCQNDEKCTVQNGPMGSIFTQCTGMQGPVGQDQPCKRQMLGDDDCQPGLICTIYGEASAGTGQMPPTACRRFCHDQSECVASGDVCVQFGGQQSPQQGVCVPTCDPFAAQVCASIAGFPGTCAQTYGDIAGGTPVFTCRADSMKGPQGSQCMTDTDCGTNAICLNQWNGSQTCGQLCDPTTACPGNTKCQTFATSPTGTSIGYCF